ncbi:MAG TPA: hypothetical protein VLH35_07650 [Candidatus Acidoferrales bacterium]|nr:hypothetical protein [Candidatus Acidoferrales bacterium]
MKEGDWIEYNVNITGTGIPPPTHDVRWFRVQVLTVQDVAFSVNLTARYFNGTIGSTNWEFNFTEGNVGGWIIIPANLDVGASFFDSSIHNHKPANVTIQSQEQKTVLGAVRTITYGNDTFRHKEWDKATGVFVGSSETYRNVTNKEGWYIDNLTVTIDAVATNLWSSAIPVASQSMFYPIVAAVILAAVVLSLAIVVARRRHVTLNPMQQIIVAIALVLGLIFAVGVISATPISESQVPLSFRDINVIMQSLWMALLLVGMWFRKKGNYLLHGILVIAVVSITIMGFLGVLVMSPMGDSSMDEYFDSPVDIAVFFAHAVFSFPALIFGVWLIALWRPSSASFPAKSKKIAWLLTVFWVLSYIVGILDYLIIRINLFG